MSEVILELPNLSKEDVALVVPEASDIGSPLRGGQKLIFPCTLNGSRYVLKFLRIKITEGEDCDSNEEVRDEAFLRASREVDIMKNCKTPHLAKLGPIELTEAVHNEQNLIYFSEEFYENGLEGQISGETVLSVEQIIRLGRNITQAIYNLWEFSKVHRDIKPSNIMQRIRTGEYVLLDMGMALDLEEESFTAPGVVPGTPAYVSPQQLDISGKRDLDFRSDLFCLGIVLYEAATKKHPFRTHKIMTIDKWLRSIQETKPSPPSAFRKDFPEKLDGVIMRMLAKESHRRFKSCQLLDEALAAPI